MKKHIEPISQINPVILRSRIDDFNGRPEHANLPVIVETLQLLAEGLVHFTDTEHKRFTSPAEQHKLAKEVFEQLVLDLAAVKPSDGFYAEECLTVRAGKKLKQSCIAWQGKMDYDDVPQNLEGLKLVIDGKFYFDGGSYDSPDLQREKAKAIYEGAKDIVLPEPQNNDEWAARMLWDLNESPWAKWFGSIQKKAGVL